MSTLAEIMANNAGYLVVEVGQAPGGQERFGWKMFGACPLLTLIGVVCRVQRELLAGEFIAQIEEPLAVIAFNKDDGFSWFVNLSDIQVDSLVGFLELVKDKLKSPRTVESAQHNAGPRLFGPDGQPMRE